MRETFTLAKDAEITMEYNPGTGESERMADYLKTGVNRLSIGLQSADEGNFESWEESTPGKSFSRPMRKPEKPGVTISISI